jgi:hypothetical protein
MDDRFYNIIPPYVLQMIGKDPRALVIVVTEEVIESLARRETASLELSDGPFSLIVLVPGILITNYYERGKNGK